MPTTMAVKAAATNVFAAAFGWPGRSPHGLRILTFHNIDEADDGQFSLTRCQISDFLRDLKDEGYRSIQARDLVAAWPSILQEERTVVLTFDDGYASHKDVAAELLVDLELTATFFVLSSLLSRQRTRTVFAKREHIFLKH